eukprot:TRINITY_DN32107_c0_g1_i1.p1 TRINITY_DN32107_c0_g1~~TRINITY_DN32107_c0_g1_i1.p1  ORF type:complete len:138 (-),score=11.12 TRINITY_DN32107_c0_g1_i1:28-417(-)
MNRLITSTVRTLTQRITNVSCRSALINNNNNIQTFTSRTYTTTLSHKKTYDLMMGNEVKAPTKYPRAYKRITPSGSISGSRRGKMMQKRLAQRINAHAVRKHQQPTRDARTVVQRHLSTRPQKTIDVSQ